MWGTVRKAIKELDPVRIENKIEKGTPDVNYLIGWIELKWQRRAPKRGGILRLDHDLTIEQRNWAIRRRHAGGRVFVLLKVGNIWIILKGEVAAEFLGYSNLETLMELAEKTWTQKLNSAELREILMRD